jgi:hypothetical protein
VLDMTLADRHRVARGDNAAWQAGLDSLICPKQHGERHAVEVHLTRPVAEVVTLENQLVRPAAAHSYGGSGHP